MCYFRRILNWSLCWLPSSCILCFDVVCSCAGLVRRIEWVSARLATLRACRRQRSPAALVSEWVIECWWVSAREWVIALDLAVSVPSLCLCACKYYLQSCVCTYYKKFGLTCRNICRRNDCRIFIIRLLQSSWCNNTFARMMLQLQLRVTFISSFFLFWKSGSRKHNQSSSTY